MARGAACRSLIVGLGDLTVGVDGYSDYRCAGANARSSSSFVPNDTY